MQSTQKLATEVYRGHIHAHFDVFVQYAICGSFTRILISRLILVTEKYQMHQNALECVLYRLV